MHALNNISSTESIILTWDGDRNNVWLRREIYPRIFLETAKQKEQRESSIIRFYILLKRYIEQSEDKPDTHNSNYIPRYTKTDLVRFKLNESHWISEL